MWINVSASRSRSWAFLRLPTCYPVIKTFKLVEQTGSYAPNPTREEYGSIPFRAVIYLQRIKRIINLLQMYSLVKHICISLIKRIMYVCMCIYIYIYIYIYTHTHTTHTHTTHTHTHMQITTPPYPPWIWPFGVETCRWYITMTWLHERLVGLLLCMYCQPNFILVPITIVHYVHKFLSSKWSCNRLEPNTSVDLTNLCIVCLSSIIFMRMPNEVKEKSIPSCMICDIRTSVYVNVMCNN